MNYLKLMFNYIPPEAEIEQRLDPQFTLLTRACVARGKWSEMDFLSGQPNCPFNIKKDSEIIKFIRSLDT